MKRRAWAAVLVCVMLSLAACKKSSSRKFPKLRGMGDSTQVLRDFQMQDILNGTKNMVLESMEGRLVDQEQAADVEAPRVTFFKTGAASSIMTAPHGHVKMDTHEVTAWGGVTVVTPDSSTLTTAQLRYDPQRRLLVSEDPVRLEKSDSITVGVGLEAEPDLSRVRIGHQKVYVKPKAH